MRTLRRLGPDAWLLAASVIAAAAVGRLFQGGLNGRAIGPLLVSAAVGSVVPAFMALKRVPLPLRAVVGTIGRNLHEPVDGDRHGDHVRLPDCAYVAHRAGRPSRGASAAQ